jgi:hypothetical protein
LKEIKMASKKKVELNSELKELVKTHIAVLPKEQFTAFEKYIVQLGKDRAKADKEIPTYIERLEARGFKITKPGEEKAEPEKKAEPTPSGEALKEVVMPGEKKSAEAKPEEKPKEKPAKSGGWMSS